MPCRARPEWLKDEFRKGSVGVEREPVPERQEWLCPCSRESGRKVGIALRR